ncbi:MAG: 2Fe-2S iron-sulfur cluster-binding protein [Candidatus Eisenbacteria bacterium]
MNGAPVFATFLPDGVTAPGGEGDTLFEMAGKAGVPVATRCRGEARCGCCLVEVLEGTENLNKIRIDERDHLPNKNYRLACRARVFGPVKVRKVVDPEKISEPE